MKSNVNNDSFGKTVLVVDNMDTNIYLLEIILKRAGYKVLTANNGFDALEKTQTILPDLILLDILMPELNGYEVCQRLKADSKTMHIPIIFITALSTNTEIEKAFNYGGCDFISKPFDNDGILARIKLRINLSEAQRDLRQENFKLKRQLQELKTLKGLIPICSSCKRIRKENEDPFVQESWQVIEQYISEHSHAEFSHGYCPECAAKVFEKVQQMPNVRVRRNPRRARANSVI